MIYFVFGTHIVNIYGIYQKFSCWRSKLDDCVEALDTKASATQTAQQQQKQQQHSS